MTHEERLRLHLAGKGATWRDDPSGTFASWDAEDGPHVVALLPQPLTAAAIVDAYVGRPGGARLTLVHDGPLSPVALRSAARFGVTLLDAATLPPPPDAVGPAPLGVAPVEAASGLVPLVAEPAVPPVVVEIPTPAPLPLLAPPEPEPLLPAHEEMPTVVEPAPETPLPQPAPALADAPAPAAVVTVEAEPAPAPFPVAAPTPAAVEAAPEVVVTLTPTEPAPLVPLVEGPALPWDPAVPVVEPAPTIHVTAGELAALPWHAHAPIEEHVEIMSGSPRRPRGHVARPTVAGAPDAAAWGLPWPRPVASADGLSIADPRIWSAQERMHAVREDLDASRGAASFGAVKPEGSAWLKRVQGMGPG